MFQKQHSVDRVPLMECKKAFGVSVGASDDTVYRELGRHPQCMSAARCTVTGSGSQITNFQIFSCGLQSASPDNNNNNNNNNDNNNVFFSVPFLLRSTKPVT